MTGNNPQKPRDIRLLPVDNSVDCVDFSVGMSGTHKKCDVSKESHNSIIA